MLTWHIVLRESKFAKHNEYIGAKVFMADDEHQHVRNIYERGVNIYDGNERCN